jgi:hypothetical protein
MPEQPRGSRDADEEYDGTDREDPPEKSQK